MRSPPECCQIEQGLRQHMPHLTKARTRGLARWTCGTIAAPKSQTCPCKPIKGEGIRWLQSKPDS